MFVAKGRTDTNLLGYDTLLLESVTGITQVHVTLGPRRAHITYGTHSGRGEP
jgi:hypothetical protein